MKPILPALLLLVLPLLPPAATAQMPWPDLRVRAGGKPVGLHGFAQGEFGLFELAAPAEVEIRTGFDVRWVDVRPKSSRIAAVIGPDHRSVRFRLDAPLPLTVEFNDDLALVLHLFAYAPEKDPPGPGAQGVRYFGPGLHRAGLIDLRDGETLYLAPGAWVKGRVRAVGARDVVIRGRGVLDGSEIPPKSVPPATPGSGGIVSSADRAAEYGMGLANLIYLDRTENARIEGITLFDSRDWTVCVRRSVGTRIEGIRILNPSEHYGDDGIDLVSSSDVTVEGCFIRTNDDCIAVKNLDDVPTHGISVRRCVLWNMPVGGNGLEIGFETGNTPISGVRFRDIDLIHVQRGSAISIHNADAATVEDIAYDNIRVEDAHRKLVDFGILYSQYSFDRPPTAAERRQRIDLGGVWDGAELFIPAEQPRIAPFRGHIRHVRITGLDVVEGALPYSLVAGFDAGHAVEDVVIRGLRYQGRPIRTAQEGKFVIDRASVRFEPAGPAAAP